MRHGPIDDSESKQRAPFSCPVASKAPCHHDDTFRTQPNKTSCAAAQEGQWRRLPSPSRTAVEDATQAPSAPSRPRPDTPPAVSVRRAGE